MEINKNDETDGAANTMNINSVTPEHLAVERQHLPIVELMLTKGAISTANKNCNSLLHLAANDGNLSTVELLLNKGAEVNTTNEYGNSPLHLTAENGHLAVMKLLLNNGAKLNMTNKYRESPLYLATKNGHFPAVEYLLNKDAEVCIRNQFGDSPLHVAAENGILPIVELLLSKSAKINVSNQFGDSPLHLAVENGNIPIVKLLLEKGAEVNKSNQFSNTPLHLAAKNGDLLAVKLLIIGAEVNMTNQSGDSPLHLATRNGNLPTIELLLNEGADVSQTDMHGDSVLHLAVAKCSSETPILSISAENYIINLLINKGINVNLKNKRGITPLYMAIEKRNLVIMNLLINRGAYLCTTDDNGDSLLHMAVNCGEEFMLNVLLNEGINVNLANNHGETPVFVAAKKNNFHIMKLLLTRGADIKSTNVNGDSLLHLAAKSGNRDIVDLLLNEGIDVNSENKLGETPLYVAAESENVYSMNLLLDRGANVNTKNNNSYSLLHLAASKNNNDMVNFILNKDVDLNSVNTFGETPLYEVLHHRNSHIIKLFLNRRANVKTTNVDGMSLLHLAVRYADEFIVSLLLNEDIDVNLANKHGETPLHWAVSNYYAEVAYCTQLSVLQLLLEKGSDVNKGDKNGNTPLHLAVFNSRSENEIGIVNLLLNKINIVRINTTNIKGESPLHLAVHKNNSTIVELLLSFGADVTLKSNTGETPLIVAKVYHFQCNEKIVDLLTAEMLKHDSFLSKKKSQNNCFLRNYDHNNQMSLENSYKSEFRYLKPIDASSGMSGQLYETKLLSLVLLRALVDENIEDIFLATNVRGIGDIDDICLRYRLKGQQKPVVLFVQAKHRENTEKGILTVNDIRSASGDFSLWKYFESYLTIKDQFRTDTEDPLFNGNFTDVISNFVIYTPLTSLYFHKKIERKTCENREKTHFLINTGHSTAGFQYDYDETDIETLAVQVQLSKLGAVFLKYIMSEKDIPEVMSADKLIARYHVVIAREVLKLSDVHMNKHFRIWIFRPEFFESNCVHLIVLKRSLFKELSTKCNDLSKISNIDRENFELFIATPTVDTLSKLIGKLITYDEKNKKLQLIEMPAFIKKYKTNVIQTLKERLNNIEIHENFINTAVQIKLSEMEIRLPLSFGNLDMIFRGSETKIHRRIKCVAEKIINLLEINKSTKIVNINDDMVGPGKIIEHGIIDFNGGIGSAVGNLLVIDTDTTMLKFNLNNKSLPHNATLLLNELQDHRFKHVNEVLSSYRININISGFPQDSFGGDEYDREQARNFLSNLWIYCDQAKHDEVERILKCDIGKFYNNKKESDPFLINPHDIFLQAHHEIKNWWQKTDNAPYLTKKNDIFGLAKKVNVNNLLLSAQNILNDLGIYHLNMKFKIYNKLDERAEEVYSEMCCSDIHKRLLDINADTKKDIINVLIKCLQNLDLDHDQKVISNSDLQKEIDKRGMSKLMPIEADDEERDLSNNTPFLFLKRTGASEVSGHLYKTKLLLLIYLRSVNDKRIHDCVLGNNIHNISAMDDICLRYQVKGQQKPSLLFVQAKHIKGSLTVESVRSDSGDLRLGKFFDSYLTIKDKFQTKSKDPLFYGDFNDIDCYLVIHTPAKNCFIKKMNEHKVNERVHYLLNTGPSTSTTDDVFQFKYDESDVDNLSNIAVLKQIKKLGAIFLELITSQQIETNMILSNELIARYHVAIAREVIEQRTNQAEQKFRTWKFRSDFFTADSEYLVSLKNVLIEELLKQRWDQSKTTIVDVRSMLLSADIKLPLAFGNLDMTFSGREAEVQKSVEDTVDKLANLLEWNKHKEIITMKDDVVGPEKTLGPVVVDISTAIGNLLILDTDTNMLKFDLTNKVLPDNAELFLKKLRNRVSKPVSEKLNRYRINVDTKRFPKYSFKADEYDKRQAKDFLSMLWFYVNQATESEIERKLIKELNKYYYNKTIQNYSTIEYENPAHSIYIRSHDDVQKWSMQTFESPYLTRFPELIERAELADIYNILLNVVNYLYVTKTSCVELNFNHIRKHGYDEINDYEDNYDSDEESEDDSFYKIYINRKMLRIFRQMASCVFKIFNPQFHQLLDIEEPLDITDINIHNCVIRIEIHPDMECVALKIYVNMSDKSGLSVVDDYYIISKASPEGGRCLIQCEDWINEIFAVSNHSINSLPP